jgi:hypothetical protein
MNDWPNYLIRTDFTEMGEVLAKVQVGEMDIINARLISTILSEYGPEAERSLWNTQPDLNELTPRACLPSAHSSTRSASASQSAL